LFFYVKVTIFAFEALKIKDVKKNLRYSEMTESLMILFF